MTADMPGIFRSVRSSSACFSKRASRCSSRLEGPSLLCVSDRDPLAATSSSTPKRLFARVLKALDMTDLLLPVPINDGRNDTARKSRYSNYSPDDLVSTINDLFVTEA